MAGEKVLIVEDDALLQKMYKTVMNNAGFVPVLASDGEEGLALVKKEMPAVVVMDVMMPKMNGLQVLDEIKADKTLAQIPVIVLTGLVKVNEEKDVKARGASMYLDKGEYDPHRLVELVKQVLSSGATPPSATEAVTTQSVERQN